jgi:hypothetical protein
VNKSAQPKLIGYPPQLGMDIFKRRNVSRGPLSMLRVRGSNPRFALRGTRTCALASVHTAPAPACNHGVLARGAFAGLGKATLTRPAGPKPRATARLNESFSVH